MNYKDFNILHFNGRAYNLFSNNLSLSNSSLNTDVLLFINQWANNKTYIEVKTSGSTGKPKTIKIQKQYMLESAKMTCTYFGLNKKTNALLCMSAKHIGGIMMIVRALYAKMNLLVVEPSSNPLENISNHIDFTAMVPYQVSASIEHNLSKLKQIKQLIIGGGTINYLLEQNIVKHQINAFHTFGMTETISHIALKNVLKENTFHCLSGIKIMQNNEDKTLIINAPNIGQQHLQTNDIVDLIDHKTFIWKGRKDFAIESGGIKIHPEIVEQKLAPYIPQNYFISSIADNKLNNKVILIIEGKEKKLPTTLFNVVEKYEKPKEIYFVETFIKTPSGKTDRINTLKQIIK